MSFKNKKLVFIFMKLYKLHHALGNEWQANSYKKTINIIENYDSKIETSNDLKNIDGIGKRTLLKIDEILTTGKLRLLDELENDKNILARLKLQNVLGIGPKFAKKLVEEKNICSIKDLYKNYKNGKIKLTHMQEIGIKYYKTLNKKISREDIEKYVSRVKKAFKKYNLQLEIIIAGSYRRGKKESGDIDLIISFEDINTKKELENVSKIILQRIIEILKEEKLILDVVNMGKFDMMYINDLCQHVDIKLSPGELMPFFLLYFGSGEEFSREIRKRAKMKGYKLSQWGLNGFKNIKTEKNIFDKLNMKYIRPENR